MSQSATDGAPKVPSATVTASAAVMGLPLDDEATASRIAAGADAAVAAVRGVLAQLDDAGAAALFEREPADYLALLESLAEPSTDGPSAPGRLSPDPR